MSRSPENYRRNIDHGKGAVDSSYRWVDLGCEGEVYSFTITNQVGVGLERMVPMVLAWIKLESGEMVTRQLCDVDVDEVCVGMKVEGVARKLGEEEDGVINYAVKYRPAIRNKDL
jgi:uncharacterized OB-fold protein